MHTLYDTYTICNKDQMMISLALATALEELEKAREDGDKMGVKMLHVAINMLLEQVEAIEE